MTAPYRARIMPAVHSQIASWRLSDYLLVDVLLWLTERLPQSPTRWLVPLHQVGGGMLLQFAIVDPENRFREHIYRFRVYYHVDEMHLIVSSGTHEVRTGYFNGR